MMVTSLNRYTMVEASLSTDPIMEANFIRDTILEVSLSSESKVEANITREHDGGGQSQQ
jgi:hypothetical protein